MARKRPERAVGRPGDRLLSPELLNKVRLEPELFIAVFDDLSEAIGQRRRRRTNLVDAMLISYCRFYDIDPDQALDPQTMLEMAALASRLSALVDALEKSGVEGDPERTPAVAEAACAARLIERDGRPAFQLLDFLAVLARAEGR
jgi:hypothetical protein